MNEEKRRPYLVDRKCGNCLVPLKLEEWREGGWLYVRYICEKCGVKTVVTFSPQELAEWGRRGATAGGRA